jgi:CheY-like chemotaxis protein
LLLAENEIAILRLVETMLIRLGYRVVAAESPMKAITVVERHREKIKVLVTDAIMPELNGNDLAIRSRGLIPGLLALFMSGYAANVINAQGGSG